MTTNTTPSQAASMAEDYGFINLAANYGMAWTGTKESEQKHLKALGAYIDAKLAQVEREAYSKGADDVQAHAEGIINRTVERAKKAESRLAEIQRGVEGLMQYIADHDWGGIPEPVPQIDALRALLQPQGQVTGCTHNCNQGRDCTCG